MQTAGCNQGDPNRCSAPRFNTTYYRYHALRTSIARLLVRLEAEVSMTMFSHASSMLLCISLLLPSAQRLLRSADFATAEWSPTTRRATASPDITRRSGWGEDGEGNTLEAGCMKESNARSSLHETRRSVRKATIARAPCSKRSCARTRLGDDGRSLLRGTLIRSRSVREVEDDCGAMPRAQANFSTPCSLQRDVIKRLCKNWPVLQATRGLISSGLSRMCTLCSTNLTTITYDQWQADDL